jgi:hypothetical protein
MLQTVLEASDDAFEYYDPTVMSNTAARFRLSPHHLQRSWQPAQQGTPSAARKREHHDAVWEVSMPFAHGAGVPPRQTQWRAQPERASHCGVMYLPQRYRVSTEWFMSAVQQV